MTAKSVLICALWKSRNDFLQWPRPSLEQSGAVPVAWWHFPVLLFAVESGASEQGWVSKLSGRCLVSESGRGWGGKRTESLELKQTTAKPFYIMELSMTLTLDTAFVSPLPTLQIFADSKAATASRSRRAFPVRNQQTPAQRITKDHKGLKPSEKKTKKTSESRVGMGHDGHGTYWHLQTVEQENRRTGRAAEQSPGQDPALHKQCGFLMFHPFLVFSFRKWKCICLK